MSELASILHAARAAWAAGDVPVLATVVATRGSSYRKPGARMLVTREGWKAGSVSGGCLEADVVRKAQWLVAQGQAVLKTYDTSADGEAALGCGGEVDLLLEPFHGDGALARTMARVLEERQAQTRTIALPDGTIWTETLQPPRRLVVCGAGHDALPVHAFASTLGWDVHVVDFRPALLAPARFPGATTHLLGSEAVARLPLEPGCAVVVMSHHLVYDGHLLAALLASPLPAYVGLLGPSKRTRDLLDTLPDTLPRERLHAPVGLALGGEGPAAVALAILAEVHAVFHGAPATPMTLTVPR
ncbi:MAG TPA: XdhC family protein [Burkholderiaceae bacterium]|nr:XdhC family protein [Burkholderiaceae bacterium]